MWKNKLKEKVVQLTKSQLFSNNDKTNNHAQLENEFRKILSPMQRFI